MAETPLLDILEGRTTVDELAKKQRKPAVPRRPPPMLGAPRLRVLSLGAGVQSTALCLMIKEGEMLLPDAVIFSDTQWEPRKVYKHLQWLTGCELVEVPIDPAEPEKTRLTAVPGEWQAGILPFPVHIVTHGDIRNDVLHKKSETRAATMPVFVRNKDGTDGRLQRQCTRDYKVLEITRKIRELLGVAKGRQVRGRVELWMGISMDEAQRVRDNKAPWIDNRYPLIDQGLTRQDCLNWIRTHGYPEPPKSSCIGCPYHNDTFWRDLRDNSPAEFADAVAFDEAIRHGIKGVKDDAFLHRSLVPLAQVDLRTTREKGQRDFDEDEFAEECEGMCGQ